MPLPLSSASGSPHYASSISLLHQRFTIPNPRIHRLPGSQYRCMLLKRRISPPLATVACATGAKSRGPVTAQGKFHYSGSTHLHGRFANVHTLLDDCWPRDPQKPPRIRHRNSGSVDPDGIRQRIRLPAAVLRGRLDHRTGVCGWPKTLFLPPDPQKPLQPWDRHSSGSREPDEKAA